MSLKDKWEAQIKKDKRLSTFSLTKSEKVLWIGKPTLLNGKVILSLNIILMDSFSSYLCNS